MLVSLLLAIGLRSLRMVARDAAAAARAAWCWTAGFTTLAIGQLNMISAAFAVLFIGLGVEFAIHL